MGPLSVMGFEERKQIFRPLIPDVEFITFNNEADLDKITTKTAGILLKLSKEEPDLYNHITISLKKFVNDALKLVP
jgi:hypothetical protein